jgi:hypothetical protein
MTLIEQIPKTNLTKVLYSNSNSCAFVWIQMLDVNERRMEIAEIQFLRAATVYRMLGHKCEYVRDKLQIADITTLIWLEYCGRMHINCIP